MALTKNKAYRSRPQKKARMELDPRIDPQGDHLERRSQAILAARRKKNKNV